MFIRQGIRFFSTTSSGALPSRVRVPNRSCLSIQGQDAKKFLQGLCTNDLNQLKATGDCLPTAFLTSKGRIFANSFVYLGKAVDNNDLVIETDSSLVTELKKYLTVYKLRAKATIKTTEYSVYYDQDMNGVDQVQALNQADDQVVVASLDPRIPNYGTRIIQTQSNTPVEHEDVLKEWFSTRALLHGIAEGPEILNKIPLECNLDLLNYISFNKGCYVGQELTARTRYKGLVRKRLVPFLLSNSYQHNPTNNDKAFDILSKDIEQSILSNIIKGQNYGAEIDAVQRVKKGYKVYKALSDASSSSSSSSYEKEQAIGEIIHINTMGTIGLAMINLETLFAYSGNFAVLNVPKPAVEAESVEAAQATPAVPGDSVVRFISTFKPHWFEGLDIKTNIKI